jgi:hypothetical protein
MSIFAENAARQLIGMSFADQGSARVKELLHDWGRLSRRRV